MSPKHVLYGPSTLPAPAPQGRLQLHIQASLQWLVDHSR
jgi:hypothetical protein